MLDPREFVLRPSAVAGIGARAANFINQTGRLPNQQAATVTHIEIHERAIIVEARATQDPREIAEQVIDELKRASVDGRFILSTRGLRSS
jgi:hypothetical protein